MDHSEPHRSARIEARIAPDSLLVIKRAADFQGRSVSDFVVTAAQEAANRVIEDAQLIRLSLDDQRAFVQALLDPKPLTSAMMQAKKSHRRLIINPQ